MAGLVSNIDVQEHDSVSKTSRSVSSVSVPDRSFKIFEMSSEFKSPDKREKLYLTGDPLKGAKIFKEHCAACHSINKNMKHKFGPNLYGLWGREASTVPGFQFKEYDKKKGIIWDDETLLYYFRKVHIPGTKMRFRDLDGKDQEKADLIAFLRDATAPEKSS